MPRDEGGSSPSLAAVQQALFQALQPGAPAFPDALLDALVAGDDKAPAAARIALYATMYRVRLIDSLAEDFPKLAAALGFDAFRALASAYLRAHPSESPTLRDLGRQLPGFVSAHALAEDHPWLADLAQLEWARIDVFDRADQPLEPLAALAAHAEDGFLTLTLTLIDALCVLPVRYPVEQIWRAIERGDSPEPALMEPLPGVLLVWRMPDQHVYHRRLDALEASCFTALAQGPVRFSALCADAAETLDPEAAARRMAGSLAAWAQAGLLRASRASDADTHAGEPTI